jgi:hypothetical protein
MKKAYVSNRFPFFTLVGTPVAFDAGLFETEDEAVQAKVEAHEWYGVHIHPRDLPVGDTPGQPLAPLATEARLRHGARSSRTVPSGEEGQVDRIIRAP